MKKLNYVQKSIFLFFCSLLSQFVSLGKKYLCIGGKKKPKTLSLHVLKSQTIKFIMLTYYRNINKYF